MTRSEIAAFYALTDEDKVAYIVEAKSRSEIYLDQYCIENGKVYVATIDQGIEPILQITPIEDLIKDYMENIEEEDED